jgi:hypothetical protein
MQGRRRYKGKRQRGSAQKAERPLRTEADGEEAELSAEDDEAIIE